MEPSLTAPPLPPSAPKLCPPAATAARQDEPRAPSGVDAGALAQLMRDAFGAAGEAMFQFAFVDHPTWGRTLAARADQVKADCAKDESR